MNKLFQPVQVGSLTLKNSIVFAPTSVGREGLDFYEKIAKGGASLIILPDISVIPSMLGAPSLGSLQYADYFRKVVEICHRTARYRFSCSTRNTMWTTSAASTVSAARSPVMRYTVCWQKI